MEASDAIARQWNPDRYQVLRRSQVETVESRLAAIPVGFAEVEGALLIMQKERIRIRVVEGEIERLIEAGDLRRL